MRLISRLLGLAVFLMLLGAGAMVYYAYTPLSLAKLPYEFSLKQGSSLKSAARQMQDAGVLPQDWMFVLLARGLGMTNQIKAGEYQLNNTLTPLELLDVIKQGKGIQSRLSIIEGHTFAQLRAELNAHPTLKHDSMSLSESEILRRIGASEAHAEGLFFPDTYQFASGASDLDVLKRAYQTMQKHLQESWAARAPNLPLNSPYEALILASIVEKETGAAADRPMIASVFINRLRKNMRLQTDPSVIYGMGANFDGNIRKRDLLTDTPYNTYTRDGLTPTPIALPGRAALQAALHPAASEALYFVARGDGSSQFSSTLSEHNNAVNRYQR